MPNDIFKSTGYGITIQEDPNMPRTQIWFDRWKKLTGEEEKGERREGLPPSPDEVYQQTREEAARLQELQYQQQQYGNWQYWYRQQVPPQTYPTPALTSLQYLGWTIKWTGLKQDRHDNRLAGQWLATKLGQKEGWYSSVPGTCEPMYEGDQFNVTVMDGQQPITPELCEYQKGVVLDMIYTAFADLLIVLRSTTAL